jgi:hypothetical protein
MLRLIRRAVTLVRMLPEMYLKHLYSCKIPKLEKKMWRRSSLLTSVLAFSLS